MYYTFMFDIVNIFVSQKKLMADLPKERELLHPLSIPIYS